MRTILIGAMLVLFSSQIWAADYYVRTTGTRISGASTPDDWSDSNCYATIEAALSAAGQPDRVFLFKETHTLGAAQTLDCYLANQDDDEDHSSCIVEFVPGAYFRTNSSISNTQVTGITFQNQAEGSGTSCIILLNDSGEQRSVSITCCAFLNNKGRDAGGHGSAIYCNNTNGRLLLTIDHCMFADNEALSGGAVYIQDNSEFAISNSDFSDNIAAPDGGGATWGQGGALLISSPDIKSTGVITNCTFDNNRARGNGGAVCIKDAEVVMTECVVTDSTVNWNGDNHFSTGAGVYALRATNHDLDVTFVCRNSTFIGNVGYVDLSEGFGGNYVAGDGGGICFWGKDPDDQLDFTVTDCIFEDNYNNQGGGLYAGRYSKGKVSKCVFVGNTAASNGGASYRGGVPSNCLGETTIYEYCVFIDNHTGVTVEGDPEPNGYGMGGAIGSRLYARIECYNCSFLNNTINGDCLMPWGDAIFHWDASGSFDSDDKRSKLVNCVFYGENGNDIQVRSDANGFKEVDYCAYENGEFVCDGFTPNNSLILIDNPFISSSQAELDPGSPCIDAGTDVGLTEDYKGTSVPQKAAPDIGAHEFVGTSGRGGGGCFIATAAYGSPSEAHVELLRQFRDVYLLSTKLGHAFVDAYYMYSPPIAHFIGGHDSLRAMVRWSLLPIVGVSWVALNIGPAPALIFVLLALTLISLTTTILFRRNLLGRHKS